MARSLAILVRLHRLDWADRLLLAEALVTLMTVSALNRLLPFRRIVNLRHFQQRANSPIDIAHLRWAVEACARRVPWRAVCLQSALCLRAMLDRRGVPSVMHFGIAEPGESQLESHVWLSVGGEVVIGGEQAARHHCVATFPPSPTHS